MTIQSKKKGQIYRYSKQETNVFSAKVTSLLYVSKLSMDVENVKRMTSSKLTRELRLTR